MAFNGTEGSTISLQQAGEWTENWRNNYPSESKAVFFGREALEDLLGQTGCMGIRIYFAINNNDTVTAVLVGADAHHDDITELVFDAAVICPIICSKENALNGN